MCGIAGFVGQATLSEEDRERLLSASALLRHRGPDGRGEYLAEHVLLAARRLSIVDRLGGGQPLYNEDRSLVLIANGEIYNHLDLRRRLEAHGHLFATGSDCETILHLYEDHGPDCVHHLRGMFAFALWDRRRQRLFLARDRMGEKPLYLHEQPGKLVFASEMKALVGAGVVPFRLDPAALNLYFHYNYIPEPWTAVAGVRKLPAGHYLLIDVPDWRLSEHCYWRMEDAAALEGNPPDLIRAELERVAEAVVPAEVPVGLALSGGLDSSLLAALIARRHPGRLQTFTVGYEGTPASDERHAARTLAEHLKLPWHSVELTTADVVNDFPDMVHERDDPIADYAGPGYRAVMRFARERGVPVMLQGHGGDELFWGYGWVQQAVGINQKKEAYWRDRPTHESWLRRTWRRFARISPPERLIFQELSPDYARAQRDVPHIYTADFRCRLYGAVRPESLYELPHPWPRLDLWLTQQISRTYMLANGIAQGDRLSMASGVELRLPLVDHRLVETVLGLRKNHPDHELPPKAWLRAAIGDLLPPWALTRPKRGFQPPMHDWHAGLFRQYGGLLRDGYLVQTGVLTPRAGRDLSRGEFPVDAVAPLCFKALVLEMWARMLQRNLRAGSVSDGKRHGLCERPSLTLPAR